MISNAMAHMFAPSNGKLNIPTGFLAYAVILYYAYGILSYAVTSKGERSEDKP
jgi:hypothetical protein